MIIYHRADMDGLCAGALALMYGNNKFGTPLGLDYQDPLPPGLLMEPKPHCVVDFTVGTMPFMKELMDENSIWIDHHILMIEAWEQAGKPFPAHTSRNLKSGCELAWEFFNPNAPTPKLVQWLSIFDTWQHNGHPQGEAIRHFQLGVRDNIKTITDPRWRLLFDDNENFEKMCITAGAVLESEMRASDEVYMKEWAFESRFEEMKAIVVNRAGKGSWQFGDALDTHDVGITFIYTKQHNWKIGLYSKHPDVDCGQIAKTYGGGGHKGAAGWTALTLSGIINPV